MKQRFSFFLAIALLLLSATDLHAGRTRRVSFKRASVGAGMSMSGGSFNVGVDMATPSEFGDALPLYRIPCAKCGGILPFGKMRKGHSKKHGYFIRCQRCGHHDYYRTPKTSAKPPPKQKLKKADQPQKLNSTPKKKQHKAFPSFEDKRTLR
ncbi:MAG: hypothetical protein Q4F99_06785 [bacterium]|nr:hypothetical protein [bacterium]